MAKKSFKGAAENVLTRGAVSQYYEELTPEEKSRQVIKAVRTQKKSKPDTAKTVLYASKPQRNRRVPLMVTEELYSKIKARAQAEHRTVNDLLNAVIEYVIGE